MFPPRSRTTSRSSLPGAHSVAGFVPSVHAAGASVVAVCMTQSFAATRFVGCAKHGGSG